MVDGSVGEKNDITDFILFTNNLYWFSEGVTEGWTWSTKARKSKNKLIHPNNGKNGIFDYHMWRILENLGIWGAVIIAFLMEGSFEKFFWLGVGSWFIGTFC